MLKLVEFKRKKILLSKYMFHNITMSSENLPSPIPTGGGPSESIIAQFFRETPSDSLNKHLEIPTSADKVLFGADLFNNTYSSTGAMFPNANSIKFGVAGDYVHTVVIYGCSDKNGIISMDLIDTNGASFSPAVFALKNISAASTDPLILTALLHHEINDTARLRFGGASDDDSGINYSVWSINWSAKK